MEIKEYEDAIENMKVLVIFFGGMVVGSCILAISYLVTSLIH